MHLILHERNMARLHGMEARVSHSSQWSAPGIACSTLFGVGCCCRNQDTQSQQEERARQKQQWPDHVFMAYDVDRKRDRGTKPGVHFQGEADEWSWRKR